MNRRNLLKILGLSGLVTLLNKEQVEAEEVKVDKEKESNLKLLECEKDFQIWISDKFHYGNLMEYCKLRDAFYAGRGLVASKIQCYSGFSYSITC